MYAITYTYLLKRMEKEYDVNSHQKLPGVALLT